MTTSPTRGVPVELDRKRHLRFTLRTVREMREKFGSDVLEKGVPVDRVAEMLWFGLKHEDNDLTVEQVEDLVDLQNLDAVMDAVGKATGQEGKLMELAQEAQKATAAPSKKGKKS